jgi:hypothetical protein
VVRSFAPGLQGILKSGMSDDGVREAENSFSLNLHHNGNFEQPLKIAIRLSNSDSWNIRTKHTLAD